MISAGFLVRVTGFEPAASWSQTGIENFFRTFPMIFHHFRSYSVTLVTSYKPPFPLVPRASVVIYVVKKRFPLKRTGSVFYIQGVCIVTLGRGLCKLFLRGWQLSNCGAIDKE